MKTTSFAFVLIATLVGMGTLPRVDAQRDPFQKPKPDAPEPSVPASNVLIEWDTVTLPLGDFQERSFKGELALGDGEAVWKTLMDDSAAAERSDSMMLVGLTGERRRIESIHEVIYPAEWDPPMGETVQETKPGIQTVGRPSAPMIVDGNAYHPPSAYPHPTTFQMRPVGTMLETTTKQRPDDSFSVAFSWDSVRIVAVPEYFHPTDLSKSKRATLPRFHSINAVGHEDGNYRLKRRHVASTATAKSSSTSDLPTNDTVCLNFVRPRLIQNEDIESNHEARRWYAKIEWIEVADDWFHALDPGKLAAESPTSFRDAVLANEEARLIDVIGLPTAAADQLNVGSATEYVYPTEYDPANVVGYSAGPMPLATATGFPDHPKAFQRWAPNAFPNPSAFQTRNAGTNVWITVESSENDGRQVTVNLHAELVRYAGERVCSSIETPEGEVPTIVMPRFCTMRITTMLRVNTNEPTFVGSLIPWGEDGTRQWDRRLLCFLQLDAMK